MTSPPAVTATGVSVRRGRRDVLHAVDLSVSAGEIVAVLGPNGAGKSTLLGALNETLPASAGTIVRHGRVATVMQSPGLARRSARANVELAMAWWGVARSQRRGRADTALDLMHARHLAGRDARSLSGGEQRRIHLARAVAVSPDLLLLDEPFDGLDPQTHETLREDTTQALRSAEGAVIIVLHDRRDAWAIADRILVLIDGTIQADGTPRAILDHPPTAHVARFLGYDGELRTDAGVVLTRAGNVHLATDGELPATVLRRIAIEDGLRLHLETPRGQLWAQHPSFDVAVGDNVRVTVSRGISFPV